ncbi:hypothetical protein H9P43_009370 [Blastocladiella emersonii ATCC 22665]|nr:hypothetical protein H9P43_009370 [Blastocladiella emersonii ATCC 22665]
MVQDMPTNEFDRILNDFESPDLEGWESVGKVDGIAIHRRPKAGAANADLFEYKAVGELDGLNATTAFQVYMDLDYRRKWDNIKKEHLRVLLQPGADAGAGTGGESSDEDDDVARYAKADTADMEHEERVYWRVKYPVPLMSDRDYVFVRDAREMHNSHGQTCYVVVLASDPDGDAAVAPASGVIRVTEYHQAVVFCPGADPDNSTAVYVHYFDDPKGSIPSAVVNWAVKQGVPQFLKNLRAASKNYGGHGDRVKGKSSQGIKELKSALDESLKDAFVM